MTMTTRLPWPPKMPKERLMMFVERSHFRYDNSQKNIAWCEESEHEFIHKGSGRWGWFRNDMRENSSLEVFDLC
ncbi:hypothetical protein TNCV_849311 [Trichonephila clavipes]|uniref:Uncharacterized protein n=1 Tax=Trichonephila clavipes TaxID=2585209 RepID=A0A8X6UWE8_TRICX|nr:hypothetical protein TNCV_849311 [Trichonephila clavipes]